MGNSAPVGMRVMACEKGSPAWGAGLVPWFDFVVAVNGRGFDEDHALEALMAAAASGSAAPANGALAGRAAAAGAAEPATAADVRLTVFNAKVRAQREVVVRPDKRWGGAGALGLMVEAPRAVDEAACQHCARVVRVAHRSPAFEAGLEPDVDYLLGAEGVPFESLDDVGDAVNASRQGPVLVFVYNALKDAVRTVRLGGAASGARGGGGGLGLETAVGILHEVPHRCRRTLGVDAAYDGHSAAAIAPNVRVRTPEGEGAMVASREDGSSVVRLEWGLDHGAQCSGHFGACAALRLGEALVEAVAALDSRLTSSAPRPRQGLRGRHVSLLPAPWLQLHASWTRRRRRGARDPPPNRHGRRPSAASRAFRLPSRAGQWRSSARRARGPRASPRRRGRRAARPPGRARLALARRATGWPRFPRGTRARDPTRLGLCSGEESKFRCGPGLEPEPVRIRYRAPLAGEQRRCRTAMRASLS